LFDKATIALENGKKLIIKAINNSATNKYVASVSLNGKVLKTPFFKHSQIVNGGELVFNMTDKK
jgi:putative alpha-1,2-mannosidase